MWNGHANATIFSRFFFTDLHNGKIPVCFVGGGRGMEGRGVGGRGYIPFCSWEW